MEDGDRMYSKGSSGWSSMMRNEEFQEDDVWSVFSGRKDFDSKTVKAQDPSSRFSSRALSLPSAARMIPRPTSSNINPDHEPPRHVQQHSAPVNIPDWSKIYGKSKRTSKKSAWLEYGGKDDDVGDYVGHNGRESWDSDDDDDDDDVGGDGNTMPPHEWIAQKLARSQISSFSVCEGAGRTLKGRDLSRVRNAVLTKTGFLE